MLNVKAVFQLLLFFLFKLARCDILVYNIKTQDIEFEFKDAPSKFGDPVPPDGLHGLVVYSKPSNACTPIEKPPAFQNYTGKWIVLIKRYGCQFENKIRNAEKAGYDAAIVHNVGSNALKPMAADTPTGIHIPSVFIGSESGLLIKNNYLYDSGYFILITYDIPFNFTSQLLIIFCVLVGLCLFSVIFFLIVKYFRDRRRRQRHCLPKSCLKKITIHKFKKSDPYEICAICLEEYVENDELRVLPCSHAYHSGCIDPWLIKSRRVCPVCKRMVPTDNSYVSGSESDTETDDERASLVRNSGNSTNGGTFTRLLVHPFRRPSSDSSSDSISSLSLSTETDSYRSAPETPPQLRRAGTGVVDAETVPQDYSINSGGPVETTHTSGRPNRQHPIRSHERSRRNVERC